MFGGADLGQALLAVPGVGGAVIRIGRVDFAGWHFAPQDRRHVECPAGPSARYNIVHSTHVPLTTGDIFLAVPAQSHLALGGW